MNFLGDHYIQYSVQYFLMHLVLLLYSENADVLNLNTFGYVPIA